VELASPQLANAKPKATTDEHTHHKAQGMFSTSEHQHDQGHEEEADHRNHEADDKRAALTTLGGDDEGKDTGDQKHQSSNDEQGEIETASGPATTFVR
jgi:hypothetical protein